MSSTPSIPTLREVIIYFAQKDMSEREAKEFFEEASRREWKNTKGDFYKSWKIPAYKWFYRSSYLRSGSQSQT